MNLLKEIVSPRVRSGVAGPNQARKKDISLLSKTAGRAGGIGLFYLTFILADFVPDGNDFLTDK